jgi:hypothetical protein
LLLNSLSIALLHGSSPVFCGIKADGQRGQQRVRSRLPGVGLCGSSRDPYVEIAALEFYDVDDASARFVEWHTYTREAFWTIVALWLVAMVRAIDQHVRVGNSLSELSAYRPLGLVAVTLGLPVAGLLGGFVFDLFLPGL